jgi:hypothetical protein
MVATALLQLEPSRLYLPKAVVVEAETEHLLVLADQVEVVLLQMQSGILQHLSQATCQRVHTVMLEGLVLSTLQILVGVGKNAGVELEAVGLEELGWI